MAFRVVAAGLGGGRRVGPAHRHGAVHVELLLHTNVRFHSVPRFNLCLKLPAHLNRPSFEQEGVHGEPDGAGSVREEPGLAVLALLHAPSSSEEEENKA